MTVAEAEAEKTSALSPAVHADHFVFEGVDWEYYERTLDLLERAGQHARVTYDEGRMEIMTTTAWHESVKKAVARLLEHYSFVTDIPVAGLGGLTCRKKDVAKGLEPDECYYVFTKPVVTAKGHLDLAKGPPPDLAIEVEISRTVIARKPIYARLRVPEVWRASIEALTVLRLDGTEYKPVENSAYFPDLDMKEFWRFAKAAIDNQHDALKAFDAWLGSRGAKK